MNTQELNKTAMAMVARGKGILAMDESSPTCNMRFENLGIATTVENRQAYRDMLVNTPGLSEFISGVILYDETIRMNTLDGTPFPKYLVEQGIIPGIKVDTGARDLAGHPGEKVTEGLDGLRDRLEEYRGMGARFAKWRAVITIGDDIPSRGCIEANAHALARYAALCQEAGIVPIVEPEVLINGDHTLEDCYEVTEETLTTLFSEMQQQQVAMEGVILKASMVISALDCPNRAGVQQVAEETLRCLRSTVPEDLPGVVFLSGGQSNPEATDHLNAMNKLDMNLPWPLTFSYARALQNPALKIWSGQADNVAAAQQAFYHRARVNSAASQGQYTPEMEKDAA